MARKKHLINVHTSTGTTAPTGASLYLGEIAVQHTPNDPALWIKVGSAETSTEYEKFIGLTEITNIFNMSHILGSGYTYSGLPHVNSATTIADAYSALTKELIDDEKVTAAALNDLNDRVGSLSGLVSEIDIEPLSASVVTNVQNISILSGVVEENELVTAAALNDLNDKINMISANTSGDYITREEFEDHEEVAAAAFNDLNSRIIDLSGDTDEKINNINSQFTTLSGMVLELSGNSGAGAITSVTIDGSGNVVTNATYINSALTITKGIVESGILGSGYTYSGLPYVNSATSIADAYSALTQELIKDELVVSAALNDLNERIPEPVDLEPLSASVVTNQTNIEVISAWVEDNELVTAAALNDLNNRIANVPSSADVENLSAVVFTLSATLEDDELVIAAALNDLNDKVNVISANTSGNFLTVEEYEENEEVIAAALNDLNARIIDLSGDTSDISDSVSNYGQQIQVLSGIVADISGNTGGGGGGGTDTACTEAGHYSPTTTASTLGTTTATTSFIKGINIDSKKHAISVATGTVVTAQTQLSTATTGNGNVLTNITVNNHQITKNFGMTIPSWATASTKPSYTASEVGALPTGTTLDNVADGTTRKLSNYATTGTVNTLNNTVTAHTADTSIHVTTAQTAAWNGKANTSDITITGLTVGGTNATVTNKVAAVPTASTNTFGVVKVPAQATSFLTNTSGTISVATGTGTNQVAKGSDFAAVSAATTAHTADTTVHVTAANKTTWNGKQDAISDLATIRSNAASGMAAYNNRITGGTITSGSTNSITTTNNRVAITAATLPSYSTANNDQVLMIKNGVPQWVTPSTITYSTSAPQPSVGNNGDIWIQTS